MTPRKNWQKGNSENERRIRLEKLERRTRNLGASADDSVRFRTFLLRHGIHVQDRHRRASVHRNFLDNTGKPSIETRERDQPALKNKPVPYK